ELAQRSRTGECSAELQRASNLYNPQVNDMLRELNQEKRDDVSIAANTMRMHMDTYQIRKLMVQKSSDSFETE
ncbi:hypothetical protein Tco_0455506, partial [Tanacetum coccineum]